MRLKDYMIEAVARNAKVNRYGPDPDKRSILRWLSDNGFKEIGLEYYNGKNSNFFNFIESYRNMFVLGKNNGHYTNWISIHVGGHIGESIIWFDDDGNYSGCELRYTKRNRLSCNLEDSMEYILGKN